jgi:hypothetical protein
LESSWLADDEIVFLFTFIEMTRELIERLKYRFRLWRQEQREDIWGAKGVTPVVQVYRQNESISRMVLRYGGVYLTGVGILSGVGRLIDIFIPTTRSIVFVLFVTLLCVWTCGAILSFVRAWKAKRARHSSGKPNI